jgi:hypothetical protein
MKTILLMIGLCLLGIRVGAQVMVVPTGSGTGGSATNALLTLSNIGSGAGLTNSILSLTNGVLKSLTNDANGLTWTDNGTNVSAGLAQSIKTNASPTYAGATLTGTLTAPGVYLTNAILTLNTNVTYGANATNVTINVASSCYHYVLLTNNAYFLQPTGLPAGGTNQAFNIVLKQDGTGARTVNFNTTYWKFPGGAVPTITTTAGAVDVLSCLVSPDGTAVYVVAAQNLK